MIMFLDYDGVLHPDEVYCYSNRRIVLKTANLPDEYANAELFCFTYCLEDVLNDFPEVRIVLSTSWVKVVGYNRTVARLPRTLRGRVIGATYHAQYTPHWDLLSRFGQIKDHIDRNRLGRHWIAIDNEDEGWPDTMRDYLVLTDDYAGLGGPNALADLRRKLERLRV